MLQLLRVYYKNSKLYCEILPNITPKLDTNLKKRSNLFHFKIDTDDETAFK